MWMNECEITIAASRISKPASLVKGARFLYAFCQLINEISDGWAYWSYGTKCSNDLQEIIQKGQYPINQMKRGGYRNVKPAIQKVLHFLQHCDQTKDNPTVKEFVKRWREKLDIP